jgi:hypothetical protein
MTPDLQKQYEHVDDYTMIHELRGMFDKKARVERSNISKVMFACKLVEGWPVSPHVIKMVGDLETLDKPGCELKEDLTIDVIVQSFPVSYESFIMNFHMNGMEKTIAELHRMLKIAEDSIKKNLNHVMMVQNEKKEEALDASQGQRQGKSLRWSPGLQA